MMRKKHPHAGSYTTSLVGLAPILVVAALASATGCAAGDDLAVAAQSKPSAAGIDPGAAETVTAADPDAYAPPGTKADGKTNHWFYKLSYADVMVSPDGARLLAMVPVPGPDAGFDKPGMVLVIHDLATHKTHALAEHRDVRRITFSGDGSRAFLLDADGRHVSVLALQERKTLAKLPLNGAYGALEATPDGKFLVASNPALKPIDRETIFTEPSACTTTLEGTNLAANRCAIGVIEIATGNAATIELEGALRDADFLAGGKQIALTWARDNKRLSKPSPLGQHAEGRVSIVNLAPIAADQTSLKPARTIAVGGCVDRLEKLPNGNRALLVPTVCAAGGIEVVDVAVGKLLAKLPGHGPVSVSADGSQVVAIVPGGKTYQPTGGLNPADALVVIDPINLSSKQHAVSVAITTVTIAPDGKFAYVHGTDKATGADKLVQVRLNDLKQTTVVGGATRLSHATWTKDGKLLYLLSNSAVYRISTGIAVSSHVDVPGSPELLHLRAQQDILVLGEADAPQFYLVDLLEVDKVESLHLAVQ